MKSFITVIFTLIPINFLKIFLLRFLGHKISSSAKVGINVIYCPFIELGNGSRIGHFNFIKINKLHLKESAYIKNLNYIKGPFTLILGCESGISRENRIRRASKPITYGDAVLELGFNSLIVSKHLLDLTESIKIGDNSILAGLGSQLWTHGYYHAERGTERVRIDGKINVGNNVYVGSSCVFNPGVSVGNSIHIGAGSVISKDLHEPGMYVGQSLRFIKNSLEQVKNNLKQVKEDNLIEVVYTKN